MPLAAQRTLLHRSDNAAARWSDCYSSWVRTLAPGKRAGPPPVPPAGAGAPRALLSPYARALLRALRGLGRQQGIIKPLGGVGAELREVVGEDLDGHARVLDERRPRPRGVDDGQGLGRGLSGPQPCNECRGAVVE